MTQVNDNEQRIQAQDNFSKNKVGISWEQGWQLYRLQISRILPLTHVPLWFVQEPVKSNSINHPLSLVHQAGIV